MRGGEFGSADFGGSLLFPDRSFRNEGLDQDLLRANHVEQRLPLLFRQEPLVPLRMAETGTGEALHEGPEKVDETEGRAAVSSRATSGEDPSCAANESGALLPSPPRAG